MHNFLNNELWKRCGLLIWFFSIVFLISRSARAEYFTIQSFDSEIRVNSDSSFEVKEIIDVKYRSPRHGIYREIPYLYVDSSGRKMTTPLHILSVTDGSGRKRKHKVERKGNVVHIRIGDPDKSVRGMQTYVISYRVENAIIFLDDHDELYWNVTGNYWRAPIAEASARVFMPAEHRGDNAWMACYTGRAGSRWSECTIRERPDSVEFVAGKPLGIGEGLTVAVGWEKGVVSPPPAWEKLLWRLDLAKNGIFLLPVFAFVVMSALWFVRGRDPRARSAMTVMYGPPRFDQMPLTPAEVGCLVDEKFDRRDITSSIIGLAVKGYIRIEEVKKEESSIDSPDYNLIKLKDPDESLGRFEERLMENVFRGKSASVLISDLKSEFYMFLKPLKRILYGELVRKGYFLKSPENVRSYYAVRGMFLIILGGILAVWLSSSSVPQSLLASGLAAIPVLLFSRVMPAKTRAGALAYMEILGFEEFLNRAEKDKIERLGEEDLFSKFLPYAIALDVADNWAKAFEGIYMEPSDWYVAAGDFQTHSPLFLSRSLGAMGSTLGAAMFSAPRSTGCGGNGDFSGGGASSGGGFGGGGGGSW